MFFFSCELYSVPLKRKKNIKHKILSCFQHILLKFEIIWTRIGQVTKWYCFFWNTLYISKDNFFSKHPVFCWCVCVYHHHVVPPAQISLTLSRHFFLSFTASGRSSGLHPASSHTCCMYVRAGRPAFARPYVGVHRSTSLMSSSLLLQQCPACLVCLAWRVFVMGYRWPYSWCLVGCCRQDLFNIACNILV